MGGADRPKEISEAQLTGKKAVAILQRILPDAWQFREEPQQHDVGVDGTVEIVRNAGGRHLPTGARVYVSVKGTLTLKERANSVAFPMKVRDIEYLGRHQLTAMLVVIDVAKEAAFWLDVQQYVRDNLAQRDADWMKKDSVTLIMDKKKNSWNTVEGQWPERATRGPIEISYAAIGVPSLKLIQEVDKLSNQIDGLASKLKESARLKGEIGFAFAVELYQKGRFEDGTLNLQKALEEARESSDPKLFAQVAKAKCSLLNPMDPKENYELFRLAMEGRDSAKRAGLAEDELHLNGLALDAVCHQIVRRWNRNRVFIQAGREIDEPVMALVGMEKQKELYDTFLAANKETHEAIGGLFEMGSYVAVVDLLNRSAVLHTHLYRSSRVTGAKEGLEFIRDYATRQIEVAGKIVSTLNIPELKIHHLMDRAFVQRGLFGLDEAMKTIQEAAELAKTTMDGVLLPVVEARRSALPKLYEPPPARPAKELSEEEKDQMARTYLQEVLGVDLDAEDDMSWILRVGLKDRNPERALKYCEYLDTEIHSYGLVGKMAGLPTAGTKILYCEKVHKAEMGFELDELRGLFVDGHCVGCPFRKPRLSGWRWTEKWQRDRIRSPEFLRFIENSRKM